MAEADLIPMDPFRQLARKYNDLRTDKSLPQFEVSRPGPDIQGFFNRLKGQTQVNQAATGVAVALADAERARRAQDEAQQLGQSGGSIDLSGITPRYLPNSSGGPTPFGMPFAGQYKKTSGYEGGYRSSGGHSGDDWGVPVGTPIYATMDGKVGAAGWGGDYGNEVTLSSGSYMTRFAHLSRPTVRPGDTVRRGQIIGYSGQSGNATGPHLHYEVWQNGKMTNPGGYYGR